MRVLEITQDGAGVMSLHGEDGDGFYTDGVESCIVYAFYGENGLCVIHDTGQLSIPSIRETVMACGTIHQVYTAQNTPKSTPKQNKEHRKRKKKVFSLLRCAMLEDSIDIQQGAVSFLRDGTVSLLPMTTDEFDQPPNKRIRQHINSANNLFSDRNSQFIPVDVQYIHGKCAPFPKLLKAAAAMQERAQKEAKSGDNDYSESLVALKQLGIV